MWTRRIKVLSNKNKVKMKTVKANNYNQAEKEINDLDKSLMSKVKSMIKSCDLMFFHLLAVKITDQPGQTKNKVTLDTIIVNQDKFEKLKKNSSFLGFSKLIVLHDPSLIDKTIVPTLHVHDKESIKAEARKELQKEYDDKFKARVKELEAEKLNESTTGANGGGLKEELSNDYVEAMSGKKDDLVAFMVKYEIDQSEIVNNEDRQKAITAYFESQNEE
jgi:hypothetical protein